jgi:hypothetical protein
MTASLLDPARYTELKAAREYRSARREDKHVSEVNFFSCIEARGILGSSAVSAGHFIPICVESRGSGMCMV